MSPLLQQLLQQVDQLSPEERLELIRQIAQGLKKSEEVVTAKPRWADLKGMAPYPMMGEDAQDWVSRTRREADEHRRIVGWVKRSDTQQ
ncbi:MAG: hypothetical protein P5678_26055, partial [Limnospira sp. PMC 1240.20]